MTYSRSGDAGGAWRNDGGVQPHAFDPVTQPELFSGVAIKRIFAFLIDLVVIAVPVVLGYLFILLFGLLTLGLGWMLFSVLVPAVAILYVWNTLGSARQATTGMQMMSIRLERLDGGRVDGLLAVVHSVLFWAGNVVLSPLILLATLFLDRKRTVHDLLLGTVAVRTDR